MVAVGSTWTRATMGAAANRDQRPSQAEMRRSVARATWTQRRAVTLQAAKSSACLPAYRVEHWLDQRAVADLGPLDGAFQHHSTLTPFASALRLNGVTEGEVVLLEIASGRVVARRAVTRPGQRTA